MAKKWQSYLGLTPWATNEFKGFSAHNKNGLMAAVLEAVALGMSNGTSGAKVDALLQKANGDYSPVGVVKDFLPDDNELRLYDEDQDDSMCQEPQHEFFSGIEFIAEDDDCYILWDGYDNDDNVYTREEAKAFAREMAESYAIDDEEQQISIQPVGNDNDWPF